MSSQNFECRNCKHTPRLREREAAEDLKSYAGYLSTFSVFVHQKKATTYRDIMV